MRRGGRGRWLTAASVVAVVLATGSLPAEAATASVYAGDFPDPYVLRVGRTYYAYATQTGSISVQRMQSPDLSAWQYLGDALPILPLWAEPGHTWAPTVVKRGLTYVLYYTVRHRASGRQCISRGISVLPQGPFLDLSLAPMLCQLDRGGSIDPYVLVDAGDTPHLLWKSDDNALGRPTHLWAQRLSRDALSPAGPATRILSQDQPWEAPAIEGPAMIAAGGRYFLFYGANRWETANAAIGYAVCQTPAGPCAKATTSGPWLNTRGNAAGPSGPSLFTDTTDGFRLAYHAWSPDRVGYDVGGKRALWIDRLTFVRGQPVLAP